MRTPAVICALASASVFAVTAFAKMQAAGEPAVSSRPSAAASNDAASKQGSEENAGSGLSGDLRADRRVQRLNQVIFWSVVLLFVFTVAAGAIVHFSRRYRTYVLRERAAPTPDEDVWSMHQLPPERPKQDDAGRE